MFDSLTEKLNGVIKRLKGKIFLSEKDFNSAMKKVRSALIEADVSLPAVNHLVSSIKDQVVGRELMNQVSPGEMVIKIVEDELSDMLGNKEDSLLKLSSNKSKTDVIVMVGLQGCGKTTTTAKLASMLKNQEKSVSMASLDVYRPAAQKQLEVLGSEIGVDTLPIVEGEDPVQITNRALESDANYDVLILDTAGRLNIDAHLIEELKSICKASSPSEIILVADSLTGQYAVNIADEFNKAVNLTGIILTRIDGDGRGGAALSMRYVTGCPIKFLGNGEKPGDLQNFHPDRMARRILGMGDVVSLVEKASEVMGKKEVDQLNVKVKEGKFDFNDLSSQLSTLGKMGGIANVMKFIPGMSNMKFNDKAEKEVNKSIAIIRSMTYKERSNPEILNYSRKKRITKGSATTISDLNALLNKLKQARNLAARASKFGFSSINPKEITDKFLK